MLSTPIKQVINSISEESEEKDSDQEETPPISVNEITSKAGAFYEKVRYLVDYKEESTLRQNAIERILKRKLNIEQKEEIGLSLIQELIAAGYLPNEEIPESKAAEVQKIINKYQHLRENLKDKDLIEKTHSLSAIEINKCLKPNKLEELIVDAFYQTIVHRVNYSEPVSEGELQTQVYIAVRRSLLGDDHDTLFYTLFTRYLSDWKNLDDPAEASRFSSKFTKLSNAIEHQLEHPLGLRLTSKLKNHAIYFYFIKEIINEYESDAKKIFKNEEKLEEKIEELAEEKYEKQNEITRKSGNRSVAYIFITKILIGVGMELPYDLFIKGAIHYLALGVNVIFHPLLLFAIVKTAPLPGAKNTERITEGVNQMLRNEDIEPIHVKSQDFGTTLSITFGIFYLILFGITFGGLIWSLNVLNFNIVSMGLFLFFLTLVSYFGWRIRHNAKKWQVSKEDKGFFGLLWNFITLPIVRTGRWLSRKFESINIFVFIMDFIIESPFKFVLSTFDAFITFLKEREEYFQ